MLTKMFSVITGGAAGAISRYAIVSFVYHVWGPRFPYGTMIVNVAGCFLVGYLSMIADTHLFLGQNVRILLIVGFCGAFTTFSSFILESTVLIKDGESFKAFLNISVSILLGFAALRLGIMMGE
ncbi:MAG: fluoride efflux transporter CrcB [Candidatus Omnitrophica bacterium]|nr:fluoride efflux transporter CrcB [Candidatus Omnitrophota bacterium]